MQEEFDVQKDKLSSAPVLAYPDMEAPFILETDDSGVPVCADLAHKKENSFLHPVKYASHTMTSNKFATKLASARPLSLSLG